MVRLIFGRDFGSEKTAQKECGHRLGQLNFELYVKCSDCYFNNITW